MNDNKKNKSDYYKILKNSMNQAKTRLHRLLKMMWDEDDRLVDNPHEFAMMASEYIIDQDSFHDIHSIILSGAWHKGEDTFRKKKVVESAFFESFNQYRNDVFGYFAGVSRDSDAVKKMKFGANYSTELGEQEMINKFSNQDYICGLTFGPNGSGKTDGLYKFFETMYDYKPESFEVLTNTLTEQGKEFPSWINYVSDDFQVWYHLTRIIKEGKRVYILFDEAKNSFSTQQGFYSEPSKWINVVIPLIRKFHAGVIFVYQNDRYIDKTVEDLQNFELRKYDKKTMNLGVRIGEDDWRTHRYEVDRTSIPFETYDFASFKIWLDFREIIDLLTDYHYKTAINKFYRMIRNGDTICRYLNNRDDKEKLRGKYFPDYSKKNKTID